MKKIIHTYPKTKFIAHRGLPSVIIENTLESFLEAAKLPFFGIETDVHLTTDHIAVLHHDDNLLRLSNKDIYIRNSSYNSIESIMIANIYKMPLLQEYLSLCSQYDKYAIIELKPVFSASQITGILNLIESQTYTDKTIIISFHLDNLVTVRKLLPTIELHYLTDNFNISLLNNLTTYKLNLSMHHALVTKDLMDLIHKNHLKIGAWTVNTLEQINKLATMGIDYITTDGIKK